MHRRDRVAQAEPDPRRRDPGSPVMNLRPRRPRRCPEPWLFAQRTRLAIARDPTTMSLGWRRSTPRIEVPALEAAGPEVLDQHIALERKSTDERLIIGVVEIGEYRLLATRLYEVPSDSPLPAPLAPPAQRVARVRVLDLDHLARSRRTTDREWPGDQVPSSRTRRSDSGPATRAPGRSAWLDMDPDYWTCSAGQETSAAVGRPAIAMSIAAGRGRAVHPRGPPRRPPTRTQRTLPPRRFLSDSMYRGARRPARRSHPDPSPSDEQPGRTRRHRRRCHAHPCADLERCAQAIGHRFAVAQPNSRSQSRERGSACARG